jgi:signal transduction histidine kinase/ActR/RegA family two-component response regulator
MKPSIEGVRLKSTVARVIDWFLPAALLGDPLGRRQGRLVVGVALAAAIVEPVFAARHVLVTKSAGATYVTLALAVVAGLLPLAVRRGLAPAMAVQVACGAAVLSGTGVCLARGAFLVTPLMAHVLLPIAGVFVADRRLALRWAAVGAVNLTLLAGAARAGLFELSPPSASDYPQLAFFLACGTLLALGYDRTRSELDRDRARMHEQQAGARRLESLGHLAAGVAHDFNNLLTVFRAAATTLVDELPKNDPLREEAMAIDEAVRRGVAITSRLLAFARQEPRTVGVFDARLMIAQMKPLLQRTLPSSVELSLDSGDAPVYVAGDAHELECVLLNLVVNARDAMPSGGKVTVGLEELGGGRCRITVVDTGEGIPSETLPHIFEPFFTTKARGVGTGLGLSTAWGAVKAMEGELWVASSPGKTQFFIDLPCSSPPEPAVLVAPRVKTTRATVLVVDDQVPVLRATRRLLERDGLDVLTASSGADALALMATQGAQIDALVTDVVMPGMNGAELTRRARVLRPDLPVVFMTGHIDDRALKQVIDGWGGRILVKPFSRAALASAVADALEAASTTAAVA